MKNLSKFAVFDMRLDYSMKIRITELDQKSYALSSNMSVEQRQVRDQISGLRIRV
jgi:hypothetical protein